MFVIRLFVYQKVKSHCRFHVQNLLALQLPQTVRVLKDIHLDLTPETSSVMILPQVHLRKPCYDFYFL